ncbi:hypothetical protein ABW19_dt0206793 [Dactylella cylindrospora]|nr:hypothetical protein ABW19_dt0206793 [Dactylella cylindrospora]
MQEMFSILSRYFVSPLGSSFLTLDIRYHGLMSHDLRNIEMSAVEHERELSLSFKYAYKPSLLRREDALVSPRGSVTNLGGCYPRPPVCSPSSLPLQQDAIYQSFPNLSPRASPRRSSPRGSPAKQPVRHTPTQQAGQPSSPRPSPMPSPHGTPQRTPRENDPFDWKVAEAGTPLSSQMTSGGSQANKYLRPQSGHETLSVDGGGSLKFPEHQNGNSNSLRQDNAPLKKGSREVISKEASILGIDPHRPDESPVSSQSNSKKTALPISSLIRSHEESSGSLASPLIKRRRTSAFMSFVRSPMTFPLRGQTAKNWINACLPRNQQKPSTIAPATPSNEVPNGRIHNSETPGSPRIKTPTPAEVSKASSVSDSKRHTFLDLSKSAASWRSRKNKSNETTPSLDVNPNLPIAVRESQGSCYVAGEAQRFQTPLESPTIPGTPPTPSAISPSTTVPAPKGKKPLPSYFDLRRRGTNISPLSHEDGGPMDRGFTLMPLSDSTKDQREASRAQAARLPHFVKVPLFSRAAPFAQREDYGSYSAGASPEGQSRRSSFPPVPGLSGRSSTTGTLNTGRRASFGYRDQLNFITKPDGYSTNPGSSGKHTSDSSRSASASASMGVDNSATKGTGGTSSVAGSRKSSLGERRASKVITALDMARRRSSGKTIDEGNGNQSHSSSESSKLVHWRGAEVTEDEAKMLDMLVGKHRLFSEMLSAPLDKPESSEKAATEGEKQRPGTILRRPSWRRFASTIGSPPLSGLSEEAGSSADPEKQELGDEIPDVSELYAEALQQTLGLPMRLSKNKRHQLDTIDNIPNLPPAVVDKNQAKDFITTPSDLKGSNNLPASAPASVPARTTRTEFETEILSIAMLYGRVVQEAARSPSEPERTPSIIDGPIATSRAPSLTIPERPSVGFLTSALDDRSHSDSIVSDVRRASLNPQNKGRRSSTIARLQKLAGPLGDRSKRSSTVSPLESPPEYEGKSRHSSLNVPSLVSALRNARASGRGRDTESRLGSVDSGKLQDSYEDRG